MSITSTPYRNLSTSAPEANSITCFLYLYFRVKFPVSKIIVFFVHNVLKYRNLATVAPEANSFKCYLYLCTWVKLLVSRKIVFAHNVLRYRKSSTSAPEANSITCFLYLYFRVKFPVSRIRFVLFIVSPGIGTQLLQLEKQILSCASYSYAFEWNSQCLR